MDSIKDVEGLRSLLWNEVPEARSAIKALDQRCAEIASEYGEEPFVGVYEYISEIFWWEVFEPALKRGERQVVDRCFRIVEILLEKSDNFIREAVLIRVVVHLQELPSVRILAGDNLLKELRG
ncbi:hypothetical protein [Actinomadura rugatobispora]|uniref:Uncharacterized protein n=1 Tax=Actinomadura rugatobispora TaxID=1994 RepID=A0ABW0ZX35_9ACTN|nr:hypothetical protein GCM10010200_091070 [Actinomadura rugatobispora]